MLVIELFLEKNRKTVQKGAHFLKIRSKKVGMGIAL